ncbi:MAG: hypothetical protein ACLGSA_04825 [Acidobacteriota bacterium]
MAKIDDEVRMLIREEFVRLRKQLGVIPDIAAEGCPYDKGCCMDKGCCANKGCCSTAGGEDYFEIVDIVGTRLDVLKDYLRSNKESVRAFFSKRGLDLPG